MTIGYLHVGHPEHGVARYGKSLACFVQEHISAKVVEAEVVIDGKEPSCSEQLALAVDRFREAELVHVQYNERIWGGPQHALSYLQLFASELESSWIVTLHDARSGYTWKDQFGRLLAERRKSSSRSSDSRTSEGEASRSHAFLRWMGSARRAASWLIKERRNMLTTRWVARHAERLFVFSEEGREALSDLIDHSKIATIPHFVKPQHPGVSRQDAKQRLGLDAGRVLTVLGFIHPKKGYELVVEALPALPKDVHVAFAGRPALQSGTFVERLLRRADQLHVRDRVRVTGFLSQEEWQLYLAATDLALCPFQSMSASGSLSDWIGMGTPILASDLPQIAEYNAMAPNAIATFSPRNPEAFAEAVFACLEDGGNSSRQARETLRMKLSPANIAKMHADQYHAVI